MDFVLPACEILDLLRVDGMCSSKVNQSIRSDLQRGLLEDARIKAQQSVHFCGDVSSDAAYSRAMAHMHGAIIAHAAGELEIAHQDYLKARTIFRTTTHPDSCWHEAVANLGLALVARAQRHWSNVQRYCDQGLHTLTHLDHDQSRVDSLRNTFDRRIAELQNLVAEQSPPPKDIPLVGKTVAGDPRPVVAVDPEEAQWNALHLDGDLYRIKKDIEPRWMLSLTARTPTRYFAVVVDGNSMLNAGIISGDYVIFRPQAVAENGDIVIVRIDYLDDSRSTVKHFYRRNGKIVLKADNPHYEPQELVFDQNDPGVNIVGKVVAIAARKP